MNNKKLVIIINGKGGKEDKDRKFLSDLKDLWIDYNDGPFHYAYDEYMKFCEKPVTAYNEILVFHVREPLEIEKLKKRIDLSGYIPCVTLLIKSPRTENLEYNNHADDLVNKYPYDFIYSNQVPLSELDDDFMGFFHTFIAPSWLESH